MAFQPGVPGVNPFAKKLKPPVAASPQSNANNQSQLGAVKRRLAKGDPGDALDIKQGVKDSPAEDAADAKKKKKMGPTSPAGNVVSNQISNGIG